MGDEARKKTEWPPLPGNKAIGADIPGPQASGQTQSGDFRYVARADQQPMRQGNFAIAVAAMAL